MRKLPKTISEEEFHQLIKGTRKTSHKLAFLLGFYEMMRVSEVVSLQKENINYGRRHIHIIAGKGNVDRDIKIMQEVKPFLQYLPIGIEKRALQRAINRISIKTLGYKIHFHTLRHSGATLFHNDRGFDIGEIQQFLGHASIATTMIYVHITPKHLADKVDDYYANNKVAYNYR